MKKIIGLAVLAAGLLFGGKAVAQGFGLLTFSTSQKYVQGQEVLRPASLTSDLSLDFGSVGPYVNLTGNTGIDPATDSTDWFYPYGTVMTPKTYGPGFGPSGSIPAAANSFSLTTGSPGTTVCYPFNGIFTGYPGTSPDCVYSLGPGFGTAGSVISPSTFNVTVSPSVPVGDSLEILVENATQANVGTFCSISAASTTCNGSFSSYTINSGDSVAIGFRIFGTASYSLTSATWYIQ